MNMMMEHAIEFVFFHELSHILMGHIDYLEDSVGLNIISEMEIGPNGNDFKDKPIFEHQADNLAILLSVKYLMSDKKKIDGRSAIEYSTWSCAVDIFLWIISKGPLNLSLYKSGTHPDPRMRLAYKFSKIWMIDFGGSNFRVRVQRGGKSIESLVILANLASIATAMDLIKLGYSDSVGELYTGNYLSHKYASFLHAIESLEKEKSRVLDRYAYSDAILQLCNGMLSAPSR